MSPIEIVSKLKPRGEDDKIGRPQNSQKVIENREVEAPIKPSVLDVMKILAAAFEAGLAGADDVRRVGDDAVD